MPKWKLIEKMLNENKEHGTGSEKDIGIYGQCGHRMLEVEAVFWRYRGRRLPARAAKAIRREEKRALRECLNIRE